ncbi:hypothetical protein FHS26_003672 [Rhizobium pisi]|uniref:Uncharacterized protein n=1 Tax=Rhizobium pisi TaxID=574561 RepID=A0A7W5BMW9_9HYPH|nr:hypothetical protein [Rhizobium pisi]MBB3135925.1 hypothetical protein [Rhizobium pisi]
MLETIQATFQSSKLERANYAQPDDPPILDNDKEVDFYGTIFRRSDANRRVIAIDPESASNQLAAIAKASSRGQFVIAYPALNRVFLGQRHTLRKCPLGITHAH